MQANRYRRGLRPGCLGATAKTGRNNGGTANAQWHGSTGECPLDRFEREDREAPSGSRWSHALPAQRGFLRSLPA